MDKPEQLWPGLQRIYQEAIFSLKNSPGRSGKCWNDESDVYKMLILVVNGAKADKIK